MRKEANKNIEEGNVVKKDSLLFFDYFNRFLSNRYVFDSRRMRREKNRNEEEEEDEEGKK